MNDNNTPPADPEHTAPPSPNPSDVDVGVEQFRVDVASGVVHGTPEDDGASGPWDAEPDLLVLLAGSIDEIKKTVRALQETVELQQAKIDDLDDMLKAIPDGPWAWQMMDAQQRTEQWELLYPWVAWLEDRYLRNLSGSRIGTFPADWYRHPVAVELLTALRVAHISAYRRKASVPSFALVEWHERCLWPTIDRMAKLGLFSAEAGFSNWNGPDVSPTRRDDNRFDTFLTSDLASEYRLATTH